MIICLETEEQILGPARGDIFMAQAVERGKPHWVWVVTKIPYGVEPESGFIWRSAGKIHKAVEHDFVPVKSLFAHKVGHPPDISPDVQGIEGESPGLDFKS